MTMKGLKKRLGAGLTVGILAGSIAYATVMGEGPSCLSRRSPLKACAVAVVREIAQSVLISEAMGLSARLAKEVRTWFSTLRSKA